MKGLKNISLAVALLVAGSQVEAGFWSNFKNKIKPKQTVETVAEKGRYYDSVMSGLGYACGYAKTVPGKAYNACSKENVKALGNGIAKTSQKVYRKSLAYGKNSGLKAFSFAKENGQKVLDYGKNHWKPILIGTSIGTGFVAAFYGLYRFGKGIKNYVNKKAKAVVLQNAVKADDLFEKTYKNQEVSKVGAEEKAKERTKEDELVEEQKRYEKNLNAATGGRLSIFIRHL